MTLTFKVSGRIARPVHDVFEAVADPDQLSSYFTTTAQRGGSRPAPPSCGTSPTSPVRSRSTWSRSSRTVGSCCDGRPPTTRDEPYETTVTMEFEPLDDGRTLVTIAEEGWRDTEPARRRRTATARDGPGCCAR